MNFWTDDIFDNKDKCPQPSLGISKCHHIEIHNLILSGAYENLASAALITGSHPCP